VVKADGYGHGLERVARALGGADAFGVAALSDAERLRAAGLSQPVVLLSGFNEPGDIEQLRRLNVETVVHHPVQLEMLEQAAPGDPVRCWLKLDTGMHRLGFMPSEIAPLIAELKDSPHLKAISVFSHLAASEDPAQDDFTLAQDSLFRQMTGDLQQMLAYPFLRHLANSAAIQRHPGLQYDMVRLGLGLYGIDSTGLLQEKLRNVSTLKTTISQLKQVPAGDTVGYGRKGTVGTGKTIATLPIGYADGYTRRLSNGVGKMLVGGQPAPVIGQVCMDMVMLDVSHIEGVKEGDEVIVFGEDLPLPQLAGWADTIPYEIMTGISQRVKRIYFQE